MWWDDGKWLASRKIRTAYCITYTLESVPVPKAKFLIPENTKLHSKKLLCRVRMVLVLLHMLPVKAAVARIAAMRIQGQTKKMRQWVDGKLHMSCYKLHHYVPVVTHKCSSQIESRCGYSIVKAVIKLWSLEPRPRVRVHQRRHLASEWLTIPN